MRLPALICLLLLAVSQAKPTDTQENAEEEKEVVINLTGAADGPDLDEKVGEKLDSVVDWVAGHAKNAGKKISQWGKTAGDAIADVAIAVWGETSGAAKSAGDFLSDIPKGAARTYESAKVYFTTKVTQADQMFQDNNSIQELKKLLAMIKAFLTGVKEHEPEFRANATEHQAQSLDRLEEKIQLVELTERKVVNEESEDNRKAEMETFAYELFKEDFMADLSELAKNYPLPINTTIVMNDSSEEKAD